MTTTSKNDEIPAPPARVAAVEDLPFWDAIDNGLFVLARCVCGAYYARAQACLVCLADAASHRWVSATGRGTVRSFIVFDKPYHPYFAGLVPYVVAVVTLAEGPELVTNVIDIDVELVRIGMPVQIAIVERGGQKIHQARPAA